MKSTLPLNALNTLDDWRHAEPPAEAQAATLAAMRRALAQRKGAAQQSWFEKLRPARWLAWSGAAASVTGVLGVVLVFSISLPATSQPEFSASAFVPVVSDERWQKAMHETDEHGRPEGTAWVVSTEIPRERLAVLGLPYDPSEADTPVKAELLMHSSGEVLAVRLLR